MIRNNYKTLMSGLVALSIVSACGQNQKPATAKAGPTAPAKGAPVSAAPEAPASNDTDDHSAIQLVPDSGLPSSSLNGPVSDNLVDRLASRRTEYQLAEQAVKEMRQRIQISIDAKEDAKIYVSGGLLALALSAGATTWTAVKVKTIPTVPNAQQSQTMVLAERPYLNPSELKFTQILKQVEKQVNEASGDAKLTLTVLGVEYKNQTKGQIINDVWLRAGNRSKTLKITMPQEVIDRLNKSERLDVATNGGLFVDDAKRVGAVQGAWAQAIFDKAFVEYGAVKARNAEFLERAVAQKIISVTKEARGKKIASITLASAAGLLFAAFLEAEASGIYYSCKVEDLPALQASLAKLEADLNAAKLNLDTAVSDALAVSK